MFAHRLFIIFIISTMSLTAFGESVSSGNANDDDIYLGPAKSNPNPVRVNQNEGTRSAMEGSTAEGNTAAQTAEGTVINVDSTNTASLSQYAPVDPEVLDFVKQLDECVRTYGADICRQAMKNVNEKRQAEKQSTYSAQIAQAQQAAMAGDPAAIKFLKDLLAQKDLAAGGSPLGFQLPQ